MDLIRAEFDSGSAVWGGDGRRSSRATCPQVGGGIVGGSPFQHRGPTDRWPSPVSKFQDPWIRVSCDLLTTSDLLG